MAEPDIVGPDHEVSTSLAAGAGRSVERQALRLLEGAFRDFERIAVSFSGAEDVVLIDLGVRVLGSDLPVFSLDTGRLHPETHRFMETVRDHYDVAIETLAPDPGDLARLVRDKGLFSFYRDGHGNAARSARPDPSAGSLRNWTPGSRDSVPTRASPARACPPRRTTWRSPRPTTRSTSSTPWRTGRDATSGTTSGAARCPTTRSTTWATGPLVASRARARWDPTNTSVKAAGGGRMSSTRSAAYTRRTWPNRFVSSTRRPSLRSRRLNRSVPPRPASPPVNHTYPVLDGPFRTDRVSGPYPLPSLPHVLDQENEDPVARTGD